jgi:glycosyltransferase involved in cell wall biosynthesis
MINGRRISVVLPAYNAEVTLSRTVAELDQDVIDEIVLVDDASTDQTVTLARELGLEPILHDVNLGYGANQKTCYRRALDLGADIIVMVHPDYQYSPLLVPAMASMIAYGEYDMVLGSRILAQNSVARGMPRYKYVANRFLTIVENVLLQQKLSEYHTGLRAFSRSSRRPFRSAPGSARYPARPAMRPSRRRSTCAGASSTGSACCARPASTGCASTGFASTPTSTSIPPRCAPGSRRPAPRATPWAARRPAPRRNRRRPRSGNRFVATADLGS